MENNWEKLLVKAVKHIESSGAETTRWTLGGGTAIFLEYRHRFSQDIDIFIPDPQTRFFAADENLRRFAHVSCSPRP